MSRKVVICGVDTSLLPKLSAKQSKEMLVKIAEGDDDARSHFIMANLRLVLSSIHRYSKRVNNMDDLFQIGCVGLIKAIDNFDISLDLSFSTYAVPMIIGEVRRFIRESNSLRVSRGIRDVAYQALHARDLLEKDSSYEVSVEDVANSISLPAYKVVYCLDALSEPLSLSDKVFNSNDDNITIMDQLKDSKVSENVWADNISLNQALKLLQSREREIIIKRYFEDKTQSEVSMEIGISQAQVSRLEKNAVSLLHNNMS